MSQVWQRAIHSARVIVAHTHISDPSHCAGKAFRTDSCGGESGMHMLSFCACMWHPHFCLPQTYQAIDLQLFFCFVSSRDCLSHVCLGGALLCRLRSIFCVCTRVARTHTSCSLQCGVSIRCPSRDESLHVSEFIKEAFRICVQGLDGRPLLCVCQTYGT